MLYARRRSDEGAFYFLGPATYVKQEIGVPDGYQLAAALSTPRRFICCVCRGCGVSDRRLPVFRYQKFPLTAYRADLLNS